MRTQQNAWIHSFIALAVICVGLWLELPARDWAVLVLTIAMVWAAEFLNTSIEAVVDLASPVHHPLAKVGKDVGAAAVLIATLAAVLIGLIILQTVFAVGSKQSQGFDGALAALAHAPYGEVLLGAVAIGLILFGVYSAMCAKWYKIGSRART